MSFVCCNLPFAVSADAFEEAIADPIQAIITKHSAPLLVGIATLFNPNLCRTQSRIRWIQSSSISCCNSGSQHNAPAM